MHIKTTRRKESKAHPWLCYLKWILIEPNQIKPSCRHRHFAYYWEEENLFQENCPIWLFESSMFGSIRKLSLSPSYATPRHTHNSMVFNDVPKQKKRITKYPAYNNLDMACITIYVSQTPNDTTLIERIVMNKYACMCMLCPKHTRTFHGIPCHNLI